MVTSSCARMLVVLAAAGLSTGACKPDDPPANDGTETNGGATMEGPGTADDTGIMLECLPGEVRCRGQQFLETCAPTGREWLAEPCDLNEWCEPCAETDSCEQDRCIGPCDIEADLPSSAGCSFIANRQLHLEETSPDGLVVANPNTELPATIQFYRTPEGERKEEAVGEPIVLNPEQDYLFELDANFVLGTSSQFRTGGTYRVESDVPIIAYLHSPLVVDRGNDSSMLLPETTLRRDYVVFSFSPHEEQPQGQGEPSYFEIVALEDFTTVTWTPPVDTAGTGINIDFVPAGETSSPLPMNRFDTVRIAASANFQEDADLRDVSGTVIKSDKPIMVVGASRCSRVPVRTEEGQELGRCDPLQEVLIPLDYWGERYVAAHSPIRDTERHWWRIYSGTADVRITAEAGLGCSEPVLNDSNCTAPNVFDGEGCTLAARGDWIQVDVNNQCSFFLDSNNTGAFMPVQYLQSSRHPTEPAAESTGIGDPAMYQMVPVEQFLSRYVFSTGRGFDFDYVQVIREVGGPSVFLDNQSVTGFNPVNATYEVADVQISEGAHVIESNVPFGIVQFGYSSDGPSDNCNSQIPGETV
ncbi:MAG: IgGFc-binding protein, partial [Nannocystaceae bacterium]